jgi:hypothetical protein
VVIEAVQQRRHLLLHEVESGLVHHVLLLRKIGGREYVLGVGFLDDKLAAFHKLVGYFHDRVRVDVGKFEVKKKRNYSAYLLFTGK